MRKSLEQLKKKGAQSYVNKPYDEAYEISADLSMAESFDGREAKVCGGSAKLDYN